MPFATTPMNLETIILSGIGHAEKGKITYLYHFYVESKRMIQMNLFSKNKLKNKLFINELMVTSGQGLGRGID